ncbi:Eco57I restriction-modification methylase domain-containing protein [Spongisporangium articulatum]|uniref:site-specific DNA-methyltransferase (adenine-specific) n=1 Tax=Spongisporangium articulatum TaxID=3362603 RepID=A0ABW8AI49_9ACTN
MTVQPRTRPPVTPTPARSRRRAMGAYYTPASPAEFMADWLVRGPEETYLEPSFGDGVFLESLHRVLGRRGLEPERVVGVELDARAVERGRGRGVLEGCTVVRRNFLEVEPFRVDAVIGNPPYVRLRHLPGGQAATAATAAGRVLPTGVDPSGSIWMPFVLHSCSFLREGGRLAFVLPYELTYVRYAQPLWEFLGAHFAALRVLHSRRRVFEDILQDVVILLADGYGGRTAVVDYEQYDGPADIGAGAWSSRESLRIRDVVNSERVFRQALLPAPLRSLLTDHLDARTVPAGEISTLRIGYVAGDRHFFHPAPGEVSRYRLPARHLRPALSSGRQIAGVGLYSSGVPAENRSRLYHPGARLGAADRAYIAAGEEQGVDQRYKCRIRDPWYVVPGVKVPDFVVSVFSERPVFTVNDAGLVASNSLICGYTPPGLDPRSVAASWYTSLTLLQCELEVHSLGGGVLILVPGEAQRVRVAPPGPPSSSPSSRQYRHLAAVDAALAARDVEGAYAAGDDPVLRGSLGLTKADLESVRDGIEVLARWRRSAGRRS